MGSPVDDLPPGFVVMPQQGGGGDLPPGFVLQNQGYDGLSDWQKYIANANTAVKKGIADVGALPGQIMNFLEQYDTGFQGAPMGDLSPGQALPTREGILSGEKLYRPETAAGSIGQAGLEGAVSGMPFGGPAALLSGVGGTAGESAGQLTAGTPAEGPARIAAAIIASGAAGLPGAIRGTPAALIHQATKDLSPAQWAMAQKLQQDANALGVRITGAEALGKDAPSLLQYQRMAEGAPGSSQSMNAFMNQRPGQVQTAGAAANNTIGPAVRDTQAVAGGAQTAAEDAIKLAELQRSNAVSPAYKSAAGDRVPMADMRSTVAAIDAELAKQPADAVKAQLQSLRKDLIAVPAVPGVPPKPGPGSKPGSPLYVPGSGTTGLPEVPKDTIDQLDSVRKYWREKINLPPIAAEATAKEVSARVGPVLKQLRDSMTKASPEYAYGKALYQQITNDIIKPLQESATGSLAKTGNLASQIALVADPSIARPETIRAVIANLSKTNPAAARDLVRLHLENSFDRANKAVMAGPNQMGGAKYNVAVAGSQQQQANLEAAIRALPNGDIKWAGYQKMLDVFEATGRRLPAGSRTDENQAARAALQGGGLAGIAAGRGTMGLRLAEWYRDFRMNKNTAKFARVLTDPDSVGLMRQLARTAPESARAQTLVAAILQIRQQSNATGRSPTSFLSPPPFSGSSMFGGQ